MLLHRLPAISAGLDHLIGNHSHFAAMDPASFKWESRDPGFAGLLRMILGQQVSTRAADAMWAKLTALLPIPEPAAFLTLDDAMLASVGFSRQKMRYGRALAEALIADPAFLTRLAELDDESVVATLTRLPGIGRWSAEVYLMFCLGRPNIWPAGDLGIVLGAQHMLGLPEKPKPADVIRIGEAWQPHRTAAALLIWNHYISMAAARKAEQSVRTKRSKG